MRGSGDARSCALSVRPRVVLMWCLLRTLALLLFVRAGLEGTTRQDIAGLGPPQEHLSSGKVNEMKLAFAEQLRGAVRDKVEAVTRSWNGHLIPLQWSKCIEVGIKGLTSPTSAENSSLPSSSAELTGRDADRAATPALEALHTLTTADRNTIDSQMETLYSKCASGSPDCQAYFHWLSDHYHRHLAVPDSTIGVFGEDTLNVFIAGGGPVGLFLANAIASSFSVDQVRVVVVEKRTFENGTKRPYERKWPTDLARVLFDGIVDPRLMPVLQDSSIQHALDRKHYVRTEIHALETALLLSCRSLGVRFLFRSVPDESCSGESFRNTEMGRILCRQASLRIDATGNRLRRFDKQSLVESNQWDYEGMRGTLHETLSRHHTVSSSGRLSLIGNDVVSHQNVLFPIFPRVGVYAVRYLKILHLPVALAPLLRRVQSLCPWDACGQIYLWDGSEKQLTMIFNLRWHEVQIFKEAIEDRSSGARLDDSFVQKLSRLGHARRGVGVDGRLTEALRSVLAACRVRALVGCERIRLAGPYAMDPFFIVPREPNETLTQDTAVSDPDDWIRIGDSVFQGDVTLGNGLGSHFAIIGHALRRWKEQMKTRDAVPMNLSGI